MTKPSRELKLTTRGKITLGRDLQTLTNEDWVDILRAAERGTAQSVLMMCYSWHQMKMNCEDKGDTMKDICAELGVSPSAASERALIGSRANELMPYVAQLPSAVMSLYEMCKIDKDNTQVKALLEADLIEPTMTRDNMKQLVKLGVKARASAVCGGDIVKAHSMYMVGGKVNESPALIDGETGEAVDPEPQGTGGKKAQEQLADQATHKQKEAEAAKEKLKTYEGAVDELMELVLQPDYLESVCGALTSIAQDEKDAVRVGQIERIFLTIQEFQNS